MDRASRYWTRVQSCTFARTRLKKVMNFGSHAQNGHTTKTISAYGSDLSSTPTTLVSRTSNDTATLKAICMSLSIRTNFLRRAASTEARETTVYKTARNGWHTRQHVVRTKITTYC